MAGIKRAIGVKETAAALRMDCGFRSGRTAELAATGEYGPLFGVTFAPLFGATFSPLFGATFSPLFGATFAPLLAAAAGVGCVSGSTAGDGRGQ